MQTEREGGRGEKIAGCLKATIIFRGFFIGPAELPGRKKRGVKCCGGCRKPLDHIQYIGSESIGLRALEDVDRLLLLPSLSSLFPSMGPNDRAETSGGEGAKREPKPPICSGAVSNCVSSLLRSHHFVIPK